MSDLDRALRELAGELEYPPTPDLAPAVERRLRAERSAPPARKRLAALALAVGLVLPTVAVAAVPSIRHAALELLGIRGVQIERTPRLRPRPPGKLELGRLMPPARAEGMVRFRVLIPRAAGLGAPDEAYFRPFPPGGSLSFAYRARAGIPRSRFTKRGLLLTEFRGTDAAVFARKFVGAGTSVEPASVNGQAGVWLAGRPHEFAYLDAHGQTRMETLRLAENTLIWQRGPLTLRLEGAISKPAALLIARSVR